MDLTAFTRTLVDIESITGNEERVGLFLQAELSRLGWEVKKIPVEAKRFNVYAFAPEEPRPAVVFSTHMDTVPPFISSSEDTTSIYGRGTCDAKGIIAAQIAAGERLRLEGIKVGLLFLVGEERDSQGARVANQQAPGARFLVNGEPTENRMALASKGTLRVEVVAKGKMAHSAYPELGESAIDKLLEALRRLRAMPLPLDPEIGPCTLNIGLIEGGRAPNVIPDNAKAELVYRLIGPAGELRRQIAKTIDGLAQANFGLEIPFARHFRIIVRLPIHHVTPMAPHRPNIEQDGLVLPRCRGESLLRPLIPANGLVHCGPQVSGGRLGQGVQRLGSHDLTSLSGFRSMWGDGSTK